MFFIVTLPMAFQETSSPFHGHRLNLRESAFNRAMSSVCVSVEWTFGMSKIEPENSFAPHWQILSGWCHPC